MTYQLHLSLAELIIAERALRHYAQLGSQDYTGVCSRLADQLAAAYAEQLRAYEAAATGSTDVNTTEECEAQLTEDNAT